MTSVVITVSIVFYLGSLAVISRYLNNRRTQEFEDLQDYYSQLIFESMDEKNSEDILISNLEEEPDHISILNFICHNILKEVEGERAEQIKQLLKHPLIKEYYLNYLESGSERKKIKALIYLKDSKFLSDTFEKKVIGYLDHDKRYIAHAAALAILSSANTELHYDTIHKVAEKYSDASFLMIEILWEYWMNENVSKKEKHKTIQKLLGSENLTLDLKSILVKIISGFNEQDFGMYLHNLLKFISEAERSKDQIKFIAALIEALGKMGYTESESTVMELLKSDVSEIKEACLFALSAFKTESSVNQLEKEYLKGGIEIRKEISFLAGKDRTLQKVMKIDSDEFTTELAHN